MSPDDAGSSPHGEDRRSSSPGKVRSLAGSVLAGIVVGVLGTLLHGQVLAVGTTVVPVGIPAALLFATSLLLFCGLWARSIAMSAVAGAVAYGVVAVLSTSHQSLVVTGSSDGAPLAALAGNLWLFGVLATTIIAIALGVVVLRPRSSSGAGGR